MKKNNNITIAGILAGTILEWYDFSLLGSLAPVISTIFFPSSSASMSLLATFGMFATGFIARPLGGLIFGHIGDRQGRRQALSLTIILMALPTTLIGLLPTYKTAGVIAPTLLIILRVLQGLASSGEYPGAICVLTEMAPKDKRRFYASLSMLGVIGGVFLGSVINMLLSIYLSSEQLHSWGWRIPFLLGIPLGLIGGLLRYKLRDSLAFINAPKHKLPVKDVVQNHAGNLIKIIMLFSLSAISFYMGYVYISGYLVSTGKITLHESMFSNSISTITMGIIIPIFGYLSDKFDSRKIMLAGVIGLSLLFYPVFILFTMGNFISLLIGQLILAFAISVFAGPLASTAADSFPIASRYTGVAVALNVGTSVFGGTAPFVAAYLVNLTGNLIVPCFYPIIISLSCLLMNHDLRNTNHLDDSECLPNTS